MLVVGRPLALYHRSLFFYSSAKASLEPHA